MIKTDKRRITQTTPRDSPGSLVFGPIMALIMISSFNTASGLMHGHAKVFRQGSVRLLVVIWGRATLHCMCV